MKGKTGSSLGGSIEYNKEWKKAKNPLKRCWVCKIEFLANQRAYGMKQPKLCEECKETKTPEEIKEAYYKKYQEIRASKNARCN